MNKTEKEKQIDNPFEVGIVSEDAIDNHMDLIPQETNRMSGKY